MKKRYAYSLFSLAYQLCIYFCAYWQLNAQDIQTTRTAHARDSSARALLQQHTPCCRKKIITHTRNQRTINKKQSRRFGNTHGFNHRYWRAYRAPAYYDYGIYDDVGFGGRFYI